MQLDNLTIEQFLQALNQEQDIEVVKKVAALFAADLKTTKETLIKICEMFGLYKDGAFVEKVKPKTIVNSIGKATTEALFSSGESLAEKYSFLGEIANISKKYQSF